MTQVLDVPAGPVDERYQRERLDLEFTWSRPRGFLGWLSSTNHKDVGMRFICTAFIFFVLAGLLALTMRLQLARPEGRLLSADLYNQFFTTHGTAMMFLFAVPVMEGMGVVLVPLMIGTRNTAFPRLMAFGYWVYFTGGVLLFGALFMNVGPDMGWFAYTPLSGPEYSAGHRVDVWSQMVTLVEIGSLAGAVSLITTIFKMRAPGMSLNRMPLFVWSILIANFMVIFAMPAVTLCSTMLSVDRLTNVSTHFFNAAEGGDALLWQHMFWFFGHPDVYIIFLPATGFISSIIPVFCRRKMFGYTALVLSMVATAFIGFGVWVHHMFVTPLPELGQGMFTASSLMIVIPSGVQIFCWAATLWGGRPWLKLPLLWVLGFFAIFIAGGLTGVFLASVSIDSQAHDTFFVVAHFHYVLIGGAVFPLFGAFYHWFPKVSGRLLDEKLGHVNFWLMLIGFNLTFYPMHHLGLGGMTRRIWTYLPQTGWGPLNMLATCGAFMMGLSVLVFIINVVRSRRMGVLAGPNPWGGGTLEWATSSPPPRYNFQHLPTAQGREPLWENAPDAAEVVGLRTDTRETLITTTLDAAPDHRYEMTGDSMLPISLATGIGVMLIAGTIWDPIWTVAGTIMCGAVLYAWFWLSGLRSKERPRPHPDHPEVD